MKIAFLILAHRAPAYIRRLVNILGEQGDAIFIHIDKAIYISSFEKNLSSQHSAHLIPLRYPITWGGFNMITATNALLEAAVTRGSFDYFYLLSGNSAFRLSLCLGLNKYFLEAWITSIVNPCRSSPNLSRA
jgi:hypothetical protein